MRLNSHKCIEMWCDNYSKYEVDGYPFCLLHATVYLSKKFSSQMKKLNSERRGN